MKGVEAQCSFLWLHALYLAFGEVVHGGALLLEKRNRVGYTRACLVFSFKHALINLNVLAFWQRNGGKS